MPTLSSDLASGGYLRLLVMGPPKVGKSTTCVQTSPPGGVYVINSDDGEALRPAVRGIPGSPARPFATDFAPGRDVQTIEACLKEARRGVKEGEYGTIVWDTITRYGSRIEEVFANATRKTPEGEADGRRYWTNYKKHLHNIVDRLFLLKAHVIVTAHFLEVGGQEIEGQTAKRGAGIVPSLGGTARASIPAEFGDIVFLEKRPGDKRVFLTSIDGVYGPGCRNLRGVSEVEAHVGKLWERMQGNE